MKKKLFSAIATILIIATCIVCLVACNPYENEEIGGGDKSAVVESNGGYVVKQGNYVYFINGYVGADADATWGAAEKQGIVRAEVKDGKIDNSTAKVLVPKSIYNTSVNGGIAIFSEWVYYATPNIDKDKNGTASTTNTDFMRTKIDGSITQLIGTIGTRSAEYFFTESRVYYYTNSTISYIDFSDMKTDKNIDDGKGADKSTLVSNVASVVWDYGCNEIYYVTNANSEDSYKNYNNLCAVNVNGSDMRTLATYNTYTQDASDQQNVYKFSLIDMYVEADGSATLYYTKSHTVGSSSSTDGLFCARANEIGDKSKEKLLNAKASSTTLFPLGYEDGALVYNSESVYCWYNGTNAESPNQVTTTSQKIWKVDAQAGVAYFTETSSATKLYKISYKGATDNATIVMEEGIKTDWLVLDFVGDDFFFFATDDDNYLHTINLTTFDKDATDEDGNLIGSTYIGVGRVETEEE